LSWQLAALILGIVWVLPVMYLIKWYYMNKMFSRNNLQGIELRQVHQGLLEQAGELEPLKAEQPTEPLPTEALDAAQ